VKPVLFYVDDEPHNLVVFEAACPDEWDVRVFDSPGKALEALDATSPSVIVSDQRMPGLSGVQFLEISRKLRPEAVRIIVTGYSDEDLVVESVRRAQVFDYIKKPWEVDELLKSMRLAIDFQRTQSESRAFQEELRRRESELREANASLKGALKDLELARNQESRLRQELECWVPPFVLMALQDQKLLAGAVRDVAGIAFDIIGSGALHGAAYRGRPIREHVIQIFSETLMRHGGWRESHSGDSAYGHFGMAISASGEPVDPAGSALAAAREFRTALKALAETSGCPVECGLALHIVRGCRLHIHSVRMNTPFGEITQKSFDTSSSDVDLLHRMEKIVHPMPGSNIVLSSDFVRALRIRPENLHDIGFFQFSGQARPAELFLIPSAYAKTEHVERLRATGASAPLLGARDAA
jgi:FixJ family two-component response regulator